jgi:hypothetical protein
MTPSQRERMSAFPHLIEKLERQWGTPECRKLLAGLLVTDREGRQGFPFDVLLAIDEIIEKHDEEFPQFKREIL